MTGKSDMKPAAIFAGVAVLGGLLFYSSRKKKRCTDLPEIWSEGGPLHLTKSAQDEAYDSARYKIREYMLSNEQYTLADVTMAVADELRDCAWEDLESDKQKQAWSGIKSIVGEVNRRAKADPDAFRASFNE